jgi:hypothetical protein
MGSGSVGSGLSVVSGWWIEIVLVLVLEKVGEQLESLAVLRFLKAHRSGFPDSILLVRTAVFEHEDDDEDE